MDMTVNILWICLKTSNPPSPLIIAVSAGNHTQALPYCKNCLSIRADSAASKKTAPYCSGECPTGQKTFFIPKVNAP